ncbi:MAG: D-alanine--D-alanine ligase family protein [bacterium]|nr:D-alanine--D-alanine ligase family protein [bacterium]
MKKTVAVIFGGKSTEHEISLESGKSVVENLDKENFDVRAILIEKNGEWLVNGERTTIEKALEGVDIAFPVLHGSYGEDGTIQGLFEIYDLPYVGCGVIGSALGMDKELSKEVWKEIGLPVVKFVTVRKSHFDHEIEKKLDELRLPVFVKPSSLGSSIGIIKIKEKNELKKAIGEAFTFGDKVVVEEAVEDIRELCISWIGNEKPSHSLVGEARGENEFFDFEAKYIKSSEPTIPAKIDPEIVEEIIDVSKKAFEVIELRGICRVDFLFDEGRRKLFVSEVNTMPGLTATSMCRRLWQATGLSYKDLLNKLVDFGFEEFDKKKRFRRLK